MSPPEGPRPLRPLARVAAILAVAAGLVALQLGVFRPWYLRWGATDEELAAALPGDELWPAPLWKETRAVTIGASAGAVWPWLAQIGQGRGGFYSYELHENLAGAQLHNADRLLGLPDPRAGERLWMAPRDAYGGRGYGILGHVDPGRALVMVSHEGYDPAFTGTWAFVLDPRGEQTRFLMRGRAGRPGTVGWLARAGRILLYEPAHFVMERRMMRGLAERAEGRPPERWALVVEPIAWLVALAVALAAGAAALWTSRSRRPLGLLAAAGLALLVLPLAGPPLVVTAACAALLVAAVPWALGRGARPAPA
jgi:hypothetical protein